MEETATWERLVEWAKEIREKQIEPSEKDIKGYGRYLDKYISDHSNKDTIKDKVEWLTGNKENKDKVNETFYQRRIASNDGKVPKRNLDSPCVTILCYRISEMEQYPVEEVCDTLITLRLFSGRTKVNPDILRRLKEDSKKKEALDSEQIEKSTLNNLQYPDMDNISEITEDDLKKFVTGFIEAMSYKVEAIYSREHSKYSELFSIYLDESCIDELFIFHQDIKPWKCVLVTYFSSGTRDEEIQQEIERIHELEKHSKVFVIVVCATDAMFRYARKLAACDRQKSIMLLCYEHQDEAYIYLKDNPKSDKERFEFLKPDSTEYFYI